MSRGALPAPAPQLPADCTADCAGGQPIGMWDDERTHPWQAAALYGAAIVGPLLASHFWPWGFAA